MWRLQTLNISKQRGRWLRLSSCCCGYGYGCGLGHRISLHLRRPCDLICKRNARRCPTAPCCALLRPTSLRISQPLICILIGSILSTRPWLGSVQSGSSQSSAWPWLWPWLASVQLGSLQSSAWLWPWPESLAWLWPWPCSLQQNEQDIAGSWRTQMIQKDPIWGESNGIVQFEGAITTWPQHWSVLRQKS